jgi:hypothetical protein
MMARLPLLALLCVGLASAESLFDDEDVAAWKEKQGEGEPAGESLFDDDEVAAYKSRQGDFEDDPEEVAKWVAFDSADNKLTTDIVFDERGTVKEGGSADPDIAFWHVVMFNGERIDEPTHGSEKLTEAIQAGEAYDVKFAPPAFAQFQCTEKVESMHVIMERFSHELPEELLQRSIGMLAAEGVSNSKQLGELHEKDYDGILLPALIKSRLRKIRAEAAEQAAVGEQKVEMDSKEVEDELKAYMDARNASRELTPEEAAAAPQVTEEASEGEEEDGTFKSLVWAVMNCPSCKGKETIACFRSCRYGTGLPGSEKKGWGECLNQCIENRWLRATFYAMLPSSR